MKDEKKVVVITGATGVLGNLAAKTFAECGHNIALLAKDQNKLDFINLQISRMTQKKH